MFNFIHSFLISISSKSLQSLDSTGFRTCNLLKTAPDRRPVINNEECGSSSATGEVFQLLEEFGRRLLDTLKDVLVERNQLTLGKELGKGQCEKKLLLLTY